jgi:receptor expression-enhancing protein 1/2/3/4
MYWIVFAAFLTVEIFADLFISFWLPFYYWLKIVFLLWLLSPWTKGASVIYRKFIHPALEKHERDIDLYLDGAKSQGYSTLLELGSRGMTYAKEVFTAAAVKGNLSSLLYSLF